MIISGTSIKRNYPRDSHCRKWMVLWEVTFFPEPPSLTSIISDEMPREWTSLRNKMGSSNLKFFFLSLFLTFYFFPCFSVRPSSKVFEREESHENRFFSPPSQASLAISGQLPAKDENHHIPEAAAASAAFHGRVKFSRIHYSSPGKTASSLGLSFPLATECWGHRPVF